RYRLTRSRSVWVVVSRTTRRAIRSLWSRCERHELVALAPAVLGLLEHGPDPAHVELVVDDAGLERRPLLRQDSVRAEHAQDREVIFGLSLVELLPAGLPDAR